MYWQLLISALMQSYFTHTQTLRLGAYRVTASLSGTPVHFTPALMAHAVEMVLAGQTGSVAVGDVQITVDQWPTS